MKENIRVFVRIRPLLRHEFGKDECVYVKDKTIKATNMAHFYEGSFDHVFDVKDKQKTVYEKVKYCVDSFIEGYNSTIFAYGQTGSGKTYTTFGVAFAQSNLMTTLIEREELKKTSDQQKQLSIAHTLSTLSKSKTGIIQRSISDIFRQITAKNLQCTVYVSFLQIYNEQIFDLLSGPQSKQPLRIREDKFSGIYVEGLTEYIVQDKIQCLELMTKGEKMRFKRGTRMNINSSRSHTLFQILLEEDQADQNGMLKKSKLNIGDLAGSEKIRNDEFPNVQHLSELKNINQSLSTLGKVIQVLSQGKTDHIPFRESKLTRLLEDSLGGNTRTCLIANICTNMEYADETISTLKFAERAKSIKTQVTINQINAQDDALVQKLQKEIEHLKEILRLKRKGDPNLINQKLYLLKEENDRLRKMALSVSDVEKLKQENKYMKLELQNIKSHRSGLDSENSQFRFNKVQFPQNIDTDEVQSYTDTVFNQDIPKQSYNDDYQDDIVTKRSRNFTQVRKHQSNKDQQLQRIDAQKREQIQAVKNEVYINNALLFSFDDMSKAYQQDNINQDSFYKKKPNINVRSSNVFESLEIDKNQDKNNSSFWNNSPKQQDKYIKRVSPQQQSRTPNLVKDKGIFQNISKLLKLPNEKYTSFIDIDHDNRTALNLPQINNADSLERVPPQFNPYGMNPEPQFQVNPQPLSNMYQISGPKRQKIFNKKLSQDQQFYMKSRYNQLQYSNRGGGAIEKATLPPQMNSAVKDKSRNVKVYGDSRSLENYQFKKQQERQKIIQQSNERLRMLDNMDEQRRLKYQMELDRLKRQKEYEKNTLSSLGRVKPRMYF